MAVLRIRNSADDGWIDIGGYVPVPSTYKHLLKIVPGTTGASQVTVTATHLAVSYNGDVIVLDSVSEADIDVTASGAQGLDTGTEAVSTMYYIWIIYNGSTVAGLLSTSASTPTMPSGYTYKRLVGEIYNDSAGDFEQQIRHDDEVWLYDTQDVFTNYTLTSTFDSWALPSAIPSGCTRLLLEVGCDIASKTLEALVSYTNAVTFSVPFNNYDGVGRNTNSNSSGYYHAMQAWVVWNGGSTLYARTSNSSTTNADQNCGVVGYRLPR